MSISPYHVFSFCGANIFVTDLTEEDMNVTASVLSAIENYKKCGCSLVNLL